MIKISPSVLSADFSILGQELQAIEAAGADLVHLDVMDAHFVPNITFGIPVIASLRKCTNLPFDVHLMMSNPLDYVEEFAKAGADIINFHVESNSDPVATIEKIRSLGKTPAITLNPGTAAEAVFPYLKDVGLVLVMTVQPGFGGQKFRAEMMPKLRAIADECRRVGNNDVLIQVDGGISTETIGECVKNGANCFVAGSSVFGKSDYNVAIADLRTAAAQL